MIKESSAPTTYNPPFPNNLDDLHHIIPVRGPTVDPPHKNDSLIRQRHGDIVLDECNLIPLAVLGSAGALSASTSLGTTISCVTQHEGTGTLAESGSPINSDRPLITNSTPPDHVHHGKVRRKGRSFSSDIDREAAWERKKELYLHEEQEREEEEEEGGQLYWRHADGGADQGFYDDDLCEDESEAEVDSPRSEGGHDVAKSKQEHIEYGRNYITYHVGDDANGPIDDYCDVTKKHIKGKEKSLLRSPHMKPRSITRTRSLTDEDMEELRGSIDLGFGFKYNERSNSLRGTLPALELYYAVNRNFVEYSQSQSSPKKHMRVRTNSRGSTSSAPSHETWHILSPGDNPNHVKDRLRHWAQAVAFSVKQGY